MGGAEREAGATAVVILRPFGDTDKLLLAGGAEL